MAVDTAANLLIAALALGALAFAGLIVVAVVALCRAGEVEVVSLPLQPSDQLLAHKLYDHPGRGH